MNILQSAVKTTFLNNANLLILWLFALHFKFCYAVAELNLTQFCEILLFVITGICIIKNYCQKIWIVPISVIIITQIIIIFDTIKRFEKFDSYDSMLSIEFLINLIHVLMITMSKFIDIPKKVFPILHFSLMIIQYFLNKNINIIVGIINFIFAYSTIEITKKNLWLEIANSFHTELVTYVCAHVPTLCETVLKGIFKKETYANLYKSIVDFMTQPSNINQHIEKVAMILNKAQNITDNIIVNDNIIIYCVLPLVLIPTFIAYILTGKFIFLILTVIDIIKIVYSVLIKNESMLQIIYGKHFINTICMLRSGIDIGITTIKIVETSLHTCSVIIEGTNGIISNTTVYVKDKVSSAGNWIIETSSDGVKVVKNMVTEHPYVTATVGTSIIALAGYIWHKRNKKN
ncbi:MAG: hypothetical protein Edafosvirus4_26 [Edafosvirus sp.]|uniref:Uncharacterized protein n=1 Tax=Edafosvirus sp. TaxID=2487765 RepID=A0A3G4ZSZ7_9VIRU|nr:MAG: hypothetical protein Edafosvirus4_26 [Edafosvirus sp.]